MRTLYLIMLLKYGAWPCFHEHLSHSLPGSFLAFSYTFGCYIVVQLHSPAGHILVYPSLIKAHSYPPSLERMTETNRKNTLNPKNQRVYCIGAELQPQTLGAFQKKALLICGQWMLCLASVKFFCPYVALYSVLIFELGAWRSLSKGLNTPVSSLLTCFIMKVIKVGGPTQ